MTRSENFRSFFYMAKSHTHTDSCACTHMYARAHEDTHRKWMLLQLSLHGQVSGLHCQAQRGGRISESMGALAGRHRGCATAAGHCFLRSDIYRPRVDTLQISNRPLLTYHLKVLEQTSYSYLQAHRPFKGLSNHRPLTDLSETPETGDDDRVSGDSGVRSLHS